MTQRFVKGLGYGVFAAMMSLSPLMASAQASQGVELKPAVIEDAAAPSQTYHFGITVRNISDSARTYTFSARDIKGLDASGLPVFAAPNETTDYSLSAWIILPQNSVTLDAGEMREIPFTVKVPAGASPGAHFGGIFLDAAAGTQQTTGAAVGYSVGTIISLKIAGDVVEEAQLREFSTDKLVYGTPAVTFSARVENKGNVLERPHGLIEVTDMLGKKVATINVNDSAAPVFPGSDRRYPVKWSSDDFAFGRYQAVVSLVYGDSARKTISAATSFWILPLKLILTLIGVLLAVLVMLYLSVRSYIRKTLRAMGATPGRMTDHAIARRERSASRMMVLTLAILIFAIAFLALLFFVFA
jgi:hypothetical protein